jgi:hypothetical protein
MKVNHTGVATTILRTETIKKIRRFKSALPDLEGIRTHRFLLHFVFKIADELDYNQQDREKVDLHYYLIRELMQLVYSCDEESAEGASYFLDEAFSLLAGNSIDDLLSYQEDVLRAYFTSEYFDSDFNTILVFDQEIQWLLETLRSLLETRSENSAAA